MKMFYSYSTQVGLFETIQKWDEELRVLFSVSHYSQ